MKKTVNTIGIIAQWGGGLAILSSFFVKDNDKAVNRRILGAGLFVGGTIARFATISVDPAPKKGSKKTEWEVHAYTTQGKLSNPIFNTKSGAEKAMADFKKLGYKNISLAPIYS